MKLITLSMILFLSLIFTACGGGGGGTTTQETQTDTTTQSVPQSKKVVLQQGELYQLSKGDKIIKDSSDARVEIKHNLSNNTTTIKLLSGEAHIE